MHEILVLGAGYAGLSATTGLAGRVRRRNGAGRNGAGRNDVRITVVNASDRFTERLRLHQLASGQELADPHLTDLLDRLGVPLVTGWVTGLDPVARTVRVDDATELHYDTLLYALGAVADTDAVPGAADHADTLDSAPNAALLASRLAALPSGATVAICGTGLTGVEAAAEIAEAHPALRVVLLGREEPAAALTPKAKAHVDAALRRLGVEVRAGVSIAEVRPGAVRLTGGDTVPAAVALWTGGVRVSPLAGKAGLDVDDKGRIVTDSALRSVSHPEIYAVGDAAAVRQTFGVLHGTCQSGMPTGAQAAANIVRELDGKAPQPFRFGYLHAPVSLGRNDAVVQFTRPDDSPRRLCLTGRPARWYKETVSAAPWPTFGRTLAAPSVAMLGWRRGGSFTR